MSEISKNTTEKFAEAYQQNNKQNALQRGVVKNGSLLQQKRFKAMSTMYQSFQLM